MTWIVFKTTGAISDGKPDNLHYLQSLDDPEVNRDKVIQLLQHSIEHNVPIDAYCVQTQEEIMLMIGGMIPWKSE